ncbi:hypothetical protein ACFQAT_10565 [Undibacterium arcticum]|uniref:Uncharacterized protein n=1 Tax=Undibacterium arcticum TaxID=1762892 RepID=A0ABV7F8F4_9BURK
MSDFDSRLTLVETALKENTDLTRDTADKTAKLATDITAMLEVFDTLQAGFKVLAALGNLAKWLAPIVTLGAAIWAIAHGKMPRWEE